MIERRLLPLLAFLLAACGARPEEAEEQPLNLILISIDTLRADRLGCYGYERETSPAMDELAAESVRFANAFAESSWTVPSHVSMLTGLYPSSHGVHLPEQRPSGQSRLLPEILLEAGYFNFAITGGAWLSAEQGFARGFPTFRTRREKILDPRQGGFKATLREAREIIAARRGKGPFFAFLHTYDVHCPYDPPEKYLAMFRSPGREEIEARGKCAATHFNQLRLTPAQAAYLSDRYDGGVRWVDDMLGRFLRFLESEGLLENSVLVVTSDHGEEFLEHGAIGHERTLFVEALRIPMIVRVPGMQPRVVETPVGLVDLVPTILDLLGIELEEPLDGRSLVPLIEGGADDGFPTHRLAELEFLGQLDSWIGLDSHLIVDRGSGAMRYFELGRDPGEQVDAAGSDPEAAAHLRAELDAFLLELEERAHAPEQRSSLSDAELEELRKLGYVEGK